MDSFICDTVLSSLFTVGLVTSRGRTDGGDLMVNSLQGLFAWAFSTFQQWMLWAAVTAMQTIATVKTTTHVIADVNVYSRTAYNARAINTCTHTFDVLDLSCSPKNTCTDCYSDCLHCSAYVPWCFWGSKVSSNISSIQKVNDTTGHSSPCE